MGRNLGARVAYTICRREGPLQVLVVRQHRTGRGWTPPPAIAGSDRGPPPGPGNHDRSPPVRRAVTGDVRLAGTAEPNPEPSPVRRTNDEEQLRDHRVEAAAIEGRHAGADGASATALRPRPRRITQSGVSRFPGTTPAMRPPDRLGGRAARGPLPSGTPSTRIRGAGRRTRGPRIRPGDAAPPPGGP